MTKTAFLHIHKCGGSSLRLMLDTLYPYGVQYPAPLDYMSKTAPYRTQVYRVPQVMKHLESTDTSAFQLFMGHYDWQLVQYLGDDVTVLTMLRNPVDQLYSQFRYFWVDTKEYRAYKVHYESSGFEGFIRETDVVNRFANQQTRFLSGRFWGFAPEDINSGVLLNAKRNLKQSVFGIMERWSESIQLFEDTLGQKLPDMDVQNFNNKYRAKPLRDGVIEQVREIQKYDMSLYDYAVKRFGSQRNGN